MKAIDLFSGAGGLSLGLKESGFEVVANVEINRDAMETYSRHESSACHYNEDVRKVSFSKYRGVVDAVVGGPPCQPFSIGGLRKGNGDERDMIPEFVRCLQEVRPELFIMENVPGLMFSKARPYFDNVILKLRSCGYKLNWGVLHAADYGVPQKRKRLIIIGHREFLLGFPEVTNGEGADMPYVTAYEALGDEPVGEPPNCPVKFARKPDLRPSPYAGHVYNGGGRPLDPGAPSHTVLASSGGYKTHWIDTENIVPKYHEHLMSGGEPWEGEVPGARRLSVEECAILQTFPTGMAFAGRRSSQYKQVGDAVPPMLSRQIGLAVLKQLSNPGSLENKAALVKNLQQSELAL